MAKDDEWLEDPFRPIKRFQKEFQQQFQPFWQFLQSFPVDMVETNKEVIVRADLPGFRKQDIHIESTEDQILIYAKRKEEMETKGENFYRKERRAGEVRRVLKYPTEVKPEEAKIEFGDGVLEIKIPKKVVSEKKKYKLL